MLRVYSAPINTDGLLMKEWVNPCTTPSWDRYCKGNSFEWVWWNNEAWAKAGCCHSSVHTHTVIINEISQKWRYIHCLQHCTFVPRYTSSQWDRIHCTLPWGQRRRRRAQLTMWIEAGGWKGATMKKSWSLETWDEQHRALYHMGKQQWINISLDLDPALSGAASYNGCPDYPGLLAIYTLGFYLSSL